jgi:hypothetical protein
MKNNLKKWLLIKIKVVDLPKLKNLNDGKFKQKIDSNTELFSTYIYLAYNICGW